MEEGGSAGEQDREKGSNVRDGEGVIAVFPVVEIPD